VKNKMKSMLRLLINIALNIVYAVASLIPKNRKLVLFSAWMGNRYSDNPRYVFEYLVKNQEKMRCVWITKNKNIAKKMESTKANVAYAWSIKGIYLQLRAKVIVFTHEVSTEFISPIIGYTTKRVQTWHGMPIKKIGYDDNLDKCKNIKLKIVNTLAPHTKNRIDLMISGSKEDGEKYITAFRLNRNVVKVTGYPRNDRLISGKKQIKQSRKIIYMPTLRGAPGSNFNGLYNCGFDYLRWDKFLRDYQYELDIKMHPAQNIGQDEMEKIAQCTNIKLLIDADDIYNYLGEYDILISDYSGVYFDFLLTGKPIVIAAIDLERYQSEDRALYYQPDDIYVDEPCRDWSAVMHRLDDYLANPSKQCMSSRYLTLQRRFHAHTDSCSSERVANQIMQLVDRGYSE